MEKKKHSGLVILIAIAIVIVLAGVGIGGYLGFRMYRVNALLDLGFKYLSEENYEDALAAYEAVFEITEKNAESYLGAADAYIGLGEFDKAIEILEKGYDITGDSEIDDRLYNIDDEINRAKVGMTGVIFEQFYRDSFKEIKGTNYDVFIIGEEMYPTYGPGVDLEDGALGHEIYDFDNDGQQEMLVLDSTQRIVRDNAYGTYNTEGEVTARMYEYENGQITQRTQYSFSPIDVLANDYFCNWYTFKKGSETYIGYDCDSSYSAISDGYSTDAVILMYNGNEFTLTVNVGHAGSDGYEENYEFVNGMRKVMDILGISGDVEDHLYHPGFVNMANVDILCQISTVFDRNAIPYDVYSTMTVGQKIKVSTGSIK